MNHLKLNNTNSFLIYQIGRFSASVLINIIMARSYLPISDLGVFESFTFYASAFSFFWITGISQGFLSIYNDVGALNKDKSIAYNTFLVFFGFSMVFSVILIFSGIFHSQLIPGLSNANVVLLSIYLIIYPSGFLVEYFLLLTKKYQNLLIYTILSFLFVVIIVPAPSRLGLKVEYCLYALIFISFLKLSYLFIILQKHSILKFNLNEIKEILKISFPLIGAALIAGSATYIDGFIVSQKFDSATFAIFRYGAREFPIFLLIASSFGTSMIPLFSKHEDIGSNLSIIKKKSQKYIRYFFPTAILFLMLSQWLFQNVFSIGFYDSYKVFDIYLLLIISRFMFPNTILIGFKQNKEILIVSSIELLINLSSSLLLANYFGYLGVAYGTVSAYFSEKIILAIVVNRKLKLSYKLYIPVNELIIYSFVLISIFILKLFVY